MASISPFFEAFLDGFTGGGVFVKLRQLGAPTEVFADEEDESLGRGLSAANLREYPPGRNEQPQT
jgi:hypothetical protein